MTTSEMQKKINGVMFSARQHGIEAFACVQGESGIYLKKFLMTDELRENVSKMLDDVVKEKFLSEGVELDSSDNIADNRNVLYEFVQTSEYSPFSFLGTYSQIKDQYSEADQDKLVGFAFRINLNENALWLYQHVYQVRMIKRSKSLYAIVSGDKVYKTLKKDVIKIDHRVDLIVLGESIITSRIDLLQKSFGFEKYIRAEAAKTISIIQEMDIVSNVDKVLAFENKEHLTNAKKLMKAKNSPVLSIKKNDLIKRLQKHRRYKNRFAFEDGRIVIRTQQDVKDFVKMLNDDIVRSELTRRDYDSTRKHLLEPEK